MLNYSQKLLRKNKIKYIVFNLCILCLIVFGIWYEVSAFDINKLGIVLTGIFLLFLGYFLYPLSKKALLKLDVISDELLKNIESAKKGVEGERLLVDELVKILNKNEYTIYPNFKIPGRNFDIDALVVGPKGIIVLENKNYTRQILFSERDIRVEVDGDFKIISPNRDPREQVRKSSETIRFYLKKGGEKVEIRCAVVFTNKVIILAGSKVSIPIIQGIENLGNYFENILPNNPKFNAKYCLHINQILRNLNKK